MLFLMLDETVKILLIGFGEKAAFDIINSLRPVNVGIYRYSSPIIEGNRLDDNIMFIWLHFKYLVFR